MASNINGLGGQSVTTGSGRSVTRSQGVTTGATSEQPAAATGDVHITGTASRMAALEQALRDLPSVNQARVSAVRSSLEDGSYLVQPERIADNLLKMEQSLGQLPDQAE